MSEIYRVSKKEKYLISAKRADAFLRDHLQEGEYLYVSIRNGKQGVKGFLDDYAGLIFAKLYLYRATLDETYLQESKTLCDFVSVHFSDDKNGGYYFYSGDSETLIMRPKDSNNGALPGGNSIMAWNLVRLSQLTNEEKYEKSALSQLNFLSGEAERNPMFYATFLSAALDYYEPQQKITVVLSPRETLEVLSLPEDSLIILLKQPTEEYKLKNNRTTYYVCKNHSCLPPVNEL